MKNLTFAISILVLVVIDYFIIIGFTDSVNNILEKRSQKIAATQTPMELNDFSKAIYSSTNTYRTQNGIDELNLDSKLTQAAQNKADDLCNNNYWSHQLKDGRPFETFIKEAGYEYDLAGENLGKGFDDPDKLMSRWKKSELHNKNLLQDFTDTGIGYSECDGKNILAVEFAK